MFVCHPAIYNSLQLVIYQLYLAMMILIVDNASFLMEFYGI